MVKLRDLAVVAPVDDQQRALVMWRHRIGTDTWAWEFPMGLVEDGEEPQDAAARELEEETGWRPGTPTPLIYAEPAAGVTDARHFVFRADGCRLAGPVTELRVDVLTISRGAPRTDRRPGKRDRPGAVKVGCVRSPGPQRRRA